MENFKWFLNWLQGFYRKTYPLATLGTRLILGGTVAGIPLTIILQANIENTFSIPLLELQTNLPSFLSGLLSLVTVLTGAYMIHYELRSSARKIARVFIAGLPNMSTDFPHGLMTRTEERKAREAVRFGSLTESKDAIADAINLINAESGVQVFQRFVLHSQCEKVFIGGLARVPFLVAYGSLFRTDNAQPIYFDKFHGKGGKWQLLNDENENVALSQSGESVMPNSEGDIGLAVAFSMPISKSSLPLDLQDHTLMIESKSKLERNLIKSQDNLEAIVSEIVQLMDKLSAQAGGSVHLFLSVQSTLAIELGRRFQEGTHKPWVIHNFDGPNGNYNWAIKLTKNGVGYYEFEDCS